MSLMPHLFEPFTLRGVTLRNRIVVSPMCQYSAHDGLGDDWHIQHLGARAAGGAGAVFTEATAVSPEGRISPFCLGLWNPAHAAFFERVVAIITRSGAVPGVQLCHAGRKGSTPAPWDGTQPLGEKEGGWRVVGPSPIPYRKHGLVPRALTKLEIADIVGAFAAAARRAREAGMKIIELHAAHGYLIHQFLSGLSNTRDDEYGGNLKSRARFLLEVIDAVRQEWPGDLPLFVRLSCTDWHPHGITAEDTIVLAKLLVSHGGVDLLDCSSGGNTPEQNIPALYPGYQVPFAERVKRESGIATGAVGLITSAELAAEVIANHRADLLFIARAVLAEPAWPLKIARALGAKVDVPKQYLRAFA